MVALNIDRLDVGRSKIMRAHGLQQAGGGQRIVQLSNPSPSMAEMCKSAYAIHCARREDKAAHIGS